MNIRILEDEKNKIVVEIPDTTFVNMLNERLWAEHGESKGFDYSSFSIDHPYLAAPVLKAKATNPSKIIADAAESILKDIEACRKQLGKK